MAKAKTINENSNGMKTNTVDKRFSTSVVTCLALFIVGVVVLVSGSTAAMSVYAVTTQRLPNCIDPTGHNLPCMLVISTFPPPPNPLQCNGSSGQILACSYATQNLSNGEQIVVITVYVPANFVFSGGPVSVVKVVVHETTTKIVPGPAPYTLSPYTLSPYTLSVTIKVGTDPIVRGNVETIIVSVSDKLNPSMKIAGAKVTAELFYHSGFHKSISCSTTNQNGVSQCSTPIGGNSTPGTFKITVYITAKGYKTASKSATFTVIPKTNTTSLANATIPINVTNPKPTNMTNPSNMTIAARSAGPTGKGSESNGTQLLPQLQPPTVDCKLNPSDPSCPQQPKTPTTKTCPDGSVIDASASCPTQSTPLPPTNNNPPTPPTDNNPPPSSSSSNNGNNNPPGGGSGSGGGSSPPSP